jgi:6-phosphogluconolactonase (cycloisomerase 2 family)
MKNGTRIVVALVFVGLILAAILAGCKGFWDLPSSTTSSSTTDSSGYFYVLNQTAETIVAYYISSGTLEKIASYSLSAEPYSMAITPNGDFLYVGTANGIYLYTIGSGGALTIGNGGAVVSSDIAEALQASNSWLIDAYGSTGEVQLDAYSISSSTGKYTGTSANQVFSISNAAVQQMVLSPDDDYLFVALGTGGSIAVPFTSGNSNPLGSTAKTIPVVNSNSSALSVAVDPGEHVFYVGETNANSTGNSGGLRVFNYSSLSGTLSQASGSPIASGGLAPHAILPLASGSYVYVANGTGNTSAGEIESFTISGSGSTYTIASGSSIAAGIVPMGLAEDSDDNFVLAVSDGGSTSSGDPDLDAYTMSSGTLTSVITSTTGTDPVGAIAIVAVP